MKTIQTVGVAGAGAMGRGIAQIAAQAGLRVKLFDTNPAALNSARDSLTNTWTMLASKGKMTEEQAHEALGKLYLIDEIKKKNPASIKFATILFKPTALRHAIKPDYIGFEIPPAFVVGYGLDYDGLGRNLADIYQLKS